ncbi:MAG: hypothetical protein COA86_02835 [Kangiella sp.]|nr:MAG: hypothetical protein COA86_02835 [Kangiella sp.]
MSVREKLFGWMSRSETPVNNHEAVSTIENKGKGWTATPENSIDYIYRKLIIDTSRRASVLDLRQMDKLDGRVKKIHKKLARDSVKGGLKIVWKEKENKRITRLFNEFIRRLNLNRREKLESDVRGLVMEGNLPLQVVINKTEITAALRMPSETIVPNVSESGRIKDLSAAYHQVDPNSQKVLASFPLWQLTMIRLEPDSFDDHGSMGRPYLDATRSVWKKLNMTETDLVIRRRERAPLKLAHNLEGASPEELDKYKVDAQSAQGDVQTDYFSNKKLAVTAIQGDANLDQIADVNYLLDTFFAGSPAPKGLFGYVGDLSRDILEDLKKDYFEEVDALQDGLAFGYYEIFRLQLLLKGINPDSHKFAIEFSERQTATPNQRADLALKHQAMRVPQSMVWNTAGVDPIEAKNKLEDEGDLLNPYPENAVESSKQPNVTITPNNAPKGESATSVNNA